MAARSATRALSFQHFIFELPQHFRLQALGLGMIKVFRCVDGAVDTTVECIAKMYPSSVCTFNQQGVLRPMVVLGSITIEDMESRDMKSPTENVHSFFVEPFGQGVQPCSGESAQHLASNL